MSTSQADVEALELRIVVDGASTAGKTTTARALGECFGRPVITPAEEAGRTLLFDWLDHTGGNSDGRPIRAQLVAVPGHLPHLRARILETADVVLFVADTTRRGLPDSVRALEQVREVLDVLDEPRPGLVLQANKRDEPDAVPMDEVREALGVDEDAPLAETVALEGEGVRLAYVYAVRAGLARIRAAGEDRVALRQLTADDLLAQLDLDPRPIEARSTVDDEPLPLDEDAPPVADDELPPFETELPTFDDDLGPPAPRAPEPMPVPTAEIADGTEADGDDRRPSRWRRLLFDRR